MSDLFSHGSHLFKAMSLFITLKGRVCVYEWVFVYVCVWGGRRFSTPFYIGSEVYYFLFAFLHTNLLMNIGIKHVFSCINIRQVPWAVLKTKAGGRGFQHLPRDLANALIKHVRSLLLHKSENISRYFLHYFVLPFHWCHANAIITD